MSEQTATKHFDFRKKSIKNLVLASIFFAATIALIPVSGSMTSMVGNAESPIASMTPSIILSVVSLIMMVIGIMLIVFDINLARHAKSSKTFGKPIISILTFSLTPAICLGCFAGSIGAIVGKVVYLVTHTQSVESPEAAMEMLKEASNICMILSIVMLVVVAWQIALNILNILANKKRG